MGHRQKCGTPVRHHHQESEQGERTHPVSSDIGRHAEAHGWWFRYHGCPYTGPRCCGPNSQCRPIVQKSGHRCAELAKSKGESFDKKLIELTGYSKTYINTSRNPARAGALGVYGSCNRETTTRAQRLCSTRLDPSEGKCTLGDECMDLHDCQCCNNGKTCAACDCPKWNATNAKWNNNRRVAKIQKLKVCTLPEAEEVATRS